MNKNNVLTLFTGEQAQYLAYHFYHLEAQQMFDEEVDVEIHRNVIWKDSQNHVPRCLVYDLKGNIKLLEHQNRTSNKKILAKLEGEPISISLAGDLQSEINKRLHAMKPKQEEQEDNQWKSVFDNFDIPSKNLVESHRQCTQRDWELYCGGKAITRRDQQLDRLIDPLRLQLEQEDYLQGYAIWGEISDGFGHINQVLVDQIRRQSPKSSIIFGGILQNSKQTQVHSLNKLIAYSEIRNMTDIFLPLYIDSQQNQYFSKCEHAGYRSLAPLLSNLYYPFLSKYSLGQYIANITQYRHNNLYSAAYTVPLIENQQINNEYSVLRYLHTKNKLNYVRPLKGDFTKLKSYSQTYVLKGVFQLQGHQTPKNTNIDFKMTDIIYSQKDQINFTEQYHRVYGQKVTAFPFHSVLFSHECLKYEIKEVSRTLKSTSPNTFQRFISEGIQKDQLKEMANQMLALYDSYDSKGQSSEDD